MYLKFQEEFSTEFISYFLTAKVLNYIIHYQKVVGFPKLEK